MIAALTGCGNSGDTSSRNNNQGVGVNDILDNAATEAGNSDTESKGNSTPSASSGSVSYSDIDLDLTTLSATMVYSEVYNMMSSPDDYMGKVVKMAGAFTYYHDEASGNYYFACIVQDATACCQQGIEFQLAGDKTYPDDYPEVGEEITVTGVFSTYNEGEYRYCTLLNAVFE